ncbi:hypothetical protein GJ496_008889 [Pomphorhynchus laevis]|nr:hypothetical protein GJ496_008889 [Pomphorhynchus laevis]
MSSYSDKSSALRSKKRTASSDPPKLKLQKKKENWTKARVGNDENPPAESNHNTADGIDVEISCGNDNLPTDWRN